LRKKENNRAFTEKNPGYWSERYEEVRQWRQRHPDYQRRWRQAKRKGRSAGEIQAERLRRAIEFTERVHLFLREIQAEIRLKSIAIAMKKAPLILKVH
jgi:ferric-dicitrate binding protein FerR (iron transport regulator)